jgi:uncharacterized protein (TIGR03435 family)
MTKHPGLQLKLHRKFMLLAAAWIAIAAPATLAQTTAPPAVVAPQTAPRAADQPTKAPEFDVISIRANKDNAQMSVNGTFRMRFVAATSPDGYSATSVSLKSLIVTAYGGKPDQISGGPGWIDTNRYDIEAKVVAADGATPQPLTREQSNLMLRSLLADRFKLVVHNETKEQPIYELVIAKGGSKLQEAKSDDSNPNGVKGPDVVARAGMTMSMGPGHLKGPALQLASLISWLSSQLGRPIVDKTGLTGKYNIDLHWTPDPGPGSEDAAPSDASGPSIFTAVQEQLGLKLNSTKGPVETLVIDHAEPPTPN